MDNEIEQYIDGQAREDICPIILEELDNYIPPSENAKAVNFVGFLWSEARGTSAIFWPKGMKLNIATKDDAYKLQKTLRKYGSSVMSGIEAAAEHSCISCPKLDLLDDYFQSGLYENREPRFGKNVKGKIDWARTIKLEKAHFNSSRVPIYLDTINSRNAPVVSEVTQIHRKMVKEAYRAFEWILGDQVIDNEIDRTKYHYSKKYARKILTQELSSQYSQVKVRKLQLMLNVLDENENRGDFSSRLIGTSKFEFVWEKMCSVYFENESSSYLDVATPAYVESNEIFKVSVNRPKPDIVISSGQSIAIIDAKYYDFKVSKPSWPDLVKQFFYAKAFEYGYPQRKVSNYLVMPKTQSNYEKVVVIGEDNQLMNTEFSPIKLIFLQPIDVIDHYLRGTTNQVARSQVLHQERAKTA